MAAYRYQADTEADTVRLAAALASQAFPGVVIALDGDLGAGKTRFAQAFAASLGVREHVTSPTFTLIREYESGRLPLYHLDVYRLGGGEADDLGLDEYLYGDGVTIVEWAERIGDLLPDDRLQIRLQHARDKSGQPLPGAREIVLRPIGAAYEKWCDNLKKDGVLT